MAVHTLSKEVFHPDLSELLTLCQRNQNLPHFTHTEFNLVTSKPGNEVFGLEPVCQVATADIVGSSTLTNWADVASLSTDVDPANRTLEVFQKFLRYQSLSAHSAINLYDFGGKFIISDGQRRVLVAKALGIESLPARVIKVEPTGVILPNESLYNEFRDRKESGLWDGQLNISLGSTGEYQKGSATITTATGIWVFARNMELVKSAYIVPSGQ